MPGLVVESSVHTHNYVGRQRNLTVGAICHCCPTLEAWEITGVDRTRVVAAPKTAALTC